MTAADANSILWGLMIADLVAAVVAGAGAAWSRLSYAPCHTPKWVDLTFLGSFVVGVLAIAVWVIA